MKITLKALFLVLALATFCSAQTKQSCSDKDLQSIRIDFDKSYKKYAFFWNTLHCFEDQAMRGDFKAISAIINLHSVGQQNAEYTEWHAEVIEQLFIKSPSKFFDVLLTKEKKTKDYAIAWLKNPLDGETEAIAAAAKKIEKKPKYKKLIQQLRQQ
jgi:hypothetical protein